MAKIILDCDLMKHRNSGLYQYCLNIGNYVQRAIEQQGFNDKLRYYIPSEDLTVFDNVNNCIVEKKHHKVIKPFLWDCDIWHAPFQSGRILPEKTNSRIKIVLTIHDLNCLHEGKPCDEQQKSLRHTQYLIDKSDAIICISEFCKNDVLLHCNVKNKPVYVIHNGTNKLHAPLLSKDSYKPKRNFIFGMGYVNRKKNFHVLLPMLKNTDLELVVVGRLDEPDYITMIKKMAIDLGVDDRFHLLGPVSEQEKSWYLENCLAYMHPSLAEGFGAPVVEAMAFGKPLFLSNFTSLPEVAGDVAFYFSSFEQDHMCTVFNEGMNAYNLNGLNKRIIDKGKEYNWATKALEYLKVYHSLV